MKKTILLYLAAAVLASAACTKEQTAPAGVQAGVPVSVTATLASTRVTVDAPDASNYCKTTWDAGDRIAVRTENGRLVVLTTEDTGSSAVFTGSIPDGDAIADAAVAYYPAAIANASTADKVNLPSSYGSAEEAARGVALRGEYDEGAASISFAHAGALLRITATRVPEKVSSIVLKAKGVSGTLDVAQGDDGWYARMGSSSASIAIASASSDRPGGVAEVFFPIPAGTLSGFSVEFLSGNELVGKQSTSKERTFARGDYAVMQEFEVGDDNGGGNGDASEFFIIGKFCGWEEGSGVIPMYEDPDHEGWLVAKDVTADLSLGFKFATNGWVKNYGYDGQKDKYAPPFVFTATYNGSGNNVYTKAYDGALDVYLYPVEGENGKAAVLPAGAPFSVGQLYFMDEGFDYQGVDPYYLHVWNSSTNYTSWQKCLASGRETINGIPYIVFDVGVDGALYLPTGVSFNFILGNTASGMRWEQRQTAFTFEGETVGLYVCQNAWNRSDETKSMEGFATFYDLSDPHIDGQPSNYFLVGSFNSESCWNTADYQMTWAGRELAYRNLYLEEGQHRFKILYMDYTNWNFFNFGFAETAEIVPGDEIAVAKSGGNVLLSVETAGEYDVFFDVFGETVRVAGSE